MKEFHPLNDLESSLLVAKGNGISIETFVQQLVRSDLALPTAKEVQGDGSGFEPILFDKQGINMLAAFTDKTRVSQLAHIAGYCLVMNGLEVLRRIPSGYGLVINPGLDVGFELSSEGIAEILKEMG
jgi:hypothetical protein